MFDQSYIFQSGTILDEGAGEAGFMQSQKNPGIVSGLGDVSRSLSGFLRSYIQDDQDKPAYGFLSALVRHGL